MGYEAPGLWLAGAQWRFGIFFGRASDGNQVK